MPATLRPLLVALSLVAPLSGCGAGNGNAGAGTPYAQEFYHSFKGNPESWPGWKLIGRTAEECVHFQPEGLRITIPAGHKANANTGLSTFVTIQGDFEITVGYEILAEPDRSDSPGETRFTVYVPLAGKGPSGPNRVTLSRTLSATRGLEYFPWLLLGEGANDKIRRDGTRRPAAGKAGRLRLVRKGHIVSYWAAEGPDGEFKLLVEFPFSAIDIKNIGLYGAVGGDEVAFDLRVLDLRVRAQGLANVPIAAGERRWRTSMVLGFGAVAAVAGYLSLWFIMRRGRRAEVPAPAQEAPQASESDACEPRT